MTTLLVSLLHWCCASLLGLCVLACGSRQANRAERLATAMLVGWHVQTMSLAMLVLFVGLDLRTAVWMMLAASMAGGAVLLTRWAAHREWRAWRCPHLRWYEWLVVIAVAEKLAFAGWQTTAIGVVFDDALNHWSGRARALFGGVNWSLDPQAENFAGYIGSKQYPLAIHFWRAATACLQNGWDDTLARADGIFFLALIVICVWLAVYRFSASRALAAGAAFVVSALPLQAWHAGAGYADIAVECFVVAALSALLRKEWFNAGLLTAGAAWCKIDGLVLFAPPLLLAVLLLHFRLDMRFFTRWRDIQAWRDIAVFASGLATIMPWLLFRIVYQLPATPIPGASLTWQVDVRTLSSVWLDVMLFDPSHFVWWISFAICLLCTGWRLWRDAQGQALLCAWTMLACEVFVIFSFTPAYECLYLRTTIHRTLLQTYGLSMVLACYGTWLATRDDGI